MKFLRKKEVVTPRRRQLQRLKEELRRCDMMIKQAVSLFELSDDEDLIEARIYQMKSLAKHRDYILNCIRSMAARESGVNV